MLTKAQTQAIRAHVALDERTQDLIRLATADLMHGPSFYHDEDEDYPGFSAAVDLISQAIEVTDLYIDTSCDEIVAESDLEHVFPADVLHLDSRYVVRALVGRKLLEYV
jgi:hypothetical protein